MSHTCKPILFRIQLYNLDIYNWSYELSRMELLNRVGLGRTNPPLRPIPFGLSSQLSCILHNYTSHHQSVIKLIPVSCAHPGYSDHTQQQLSPYTWLKNCKKSIFILKFKFSFDLLLSTQTLKDIGIASITQELLIIETIRTRSSRTLLWVFISFSHSLAVVALMRHQST